MITVVGWIVQYSQFQKGLLNPTLFHFPFEMNVNVIGLQISDLSISYFLLYVVWAPIWLVAKKQSAFYRPLRERLSCLNLE